MLSLARSRYTLPVQFVFLAINAGGVLLGVVYNANTPDLYPNNAHHKLGWIVTFVVGSQAVISVLARVAGMFGRRKLSKFTGSRAEERQGFIPVSTEAMAEHESRFHGEEDVGPYGGRFSEDSGQGTEPKSESLRSHSLSSAPSSPMKEYHEDDEGDEDLEGHVPMVSKSTRAHSVIAKVAAKISGRFWNVLLFAYNFVDRTILVLGFVALCTGIITFGRFFVSISG